MDARAAAERASLIGGAIVRRSRSAPSLDVKGAGDYVTEVDRESEQAISAFLFGETGIPVVAEESGGQTSHRYWVVDPLDGTTNFIHGFPAVGVSVALVEEGRPVAAAVHAPFLGDTWSAARGSGATLRRAEGPVVPLSISSRPPERAVVGTGFPFRRKQYLPRYLETFRRALERELAGLSVGSVRGHAVRVLEPKWICPVNQQRPVEPALADAPEQTGNTRRAV